MNLILLSEEDFITADRARLQGRRLEHARLVLKVTTGKPLKVGMLGGNLGTGVVVSVNDRWLDLEVRLEQEPPEPTPITIILALPRPKVLKRVLQGVTALGVKQIILINSWHVDKSYWQSPALETNSIREQLVLGLEQARDTILPRVLLQPRFKPFAEDTLPTLVNGTCALVAHPAASSPCPTGLQQAATLAIGPEGGFTDYEVERLVAAGMAPVHLGERPLRVETAVPALIGRLMRSGG